MSRKWFISFFVLLLSAFLPALAKPAGYAINEPFGLTFRSYEVTQDERTSLNLTDQRAVDGEAGFSISFELRISLPSAFGTIFKFIDTNLNHIDLVSNHNASRLSFIYGDANGIIAHFDWDAPSPDTWYQVEVALCPQNDSLSFHIADTTFVTRLKGRKMADFQLLFGCIGHERYYSSDLPHFTLRNCYLYDGRKTLTAFWPLSRHGDGVTYDTLHGRRASVHNGIWEIDNHLSWKKVTSFESPVNTPQITFSDDGTRLFAAWEGCLLTYHTKEHRYDSVEVRNGAPYMAFGPHLIHDGANNTLATYYPSQHSFYLYHFDQRVWDGPGGKIDLHEHHGRYFNARQRKLYTFGGYGMHLFSDSFYTYDLRQQTWSRTELPIAPRYLCAMGRYDDRLLILGGVGSLSGRQEEDQRNFYDIYSINPDSLTVTRLPDIQRPDTSPFAFSHSFVPVPEQGCLYTLVFPNDRFHSSLTLARINVETGKMELFADPIPFLFLDIRSSLDLFYCGATEKIYAVVSQPKGDVGSEVSVYSMAFPPLHSKDVIIPEPTKWKGWATAILLMVFIAISGGIWWSSHRRSSAIAEADSLAPVPPVIDKSAVFLLGGFRVIDRNGSDITKMFSPTVRQLMAFLILESQYGGTGSVSLGKVDDAFWPEMERRNAFNNRRVNLSKLRSLLLLIGGVDLVSDNGLLRLTWQENSFCDYLVLASDISALAAKRKDREYLQEILSLMTLGPLLPEMDYDWLEKYRTDFSWRLSELLTREREILEQTDLRTRVWMADAVLQQDPLDENAVSLKCRTLSALGQKGLSKNVYDTYAASFRSLFDSEPTLRYNDII